MIKKIFGVILLVFLSPLWAFADNAIQVDELWGGLTDNSGEPLAGGKVYTYVGGTSTPVALYTARDKGGSAANPIELDGYGRALVFGDGIYKFVVKDSDDTTLYTIDMLSYEYADSTSAIYAGTSTGSSNAYVLTPSPAIASYTEGLRITFIANFANTSAATVAVSGLSAITIKRTDGNNLSASDIRSGEMAELVYVSGSPGTFRLISARPNFGLETSDTPTFSSLTLSTGNIFTSTSDGSDSSKIQIGHSGNTRGAHGIFYGNENATTGQITLSAGAVSGGNVNIQTAHSSGIIKFLSGAGTEAWWIDASQHLVPQTTNGFDIGSNTGPKDVKDIYYAGDLKRRANSTWTPTVTPATGAISGLVIEEADYVRLGSFIFFRVSLTFTISSGTPASFTVSDPVAGVADDTTVVWSAYCTDNGSAVTNGCLWRYDGSDIYIQKVGGGNWTTNATTLNIIGFYRAI